LMTPETGIVLRDHLPVDESTRKSDDSVKESPLEFTKAEQQLIRRA
jgi:hypothetical protein